MMLDPDLARLIHADRERDMARDRRTDAALQAGRDLGHETFVPEPSGRPGRIRNAVRLIPDPRHGG